MGKENREHKDSVFVDLFYEDETAEKNLLSLYNALHGTDYQDEGMVRKARIGQALYKNFKNDISFEADGKVLVFGEHQSTVNPNMPLRCLMYVGRAYEQIVEDRDRYKANLVKIPMPEFYVFYNGMRNQPLEQELSLSDAFLIPAAGNSAELKVRVININPSKAHKILGKCGVLWEYSQFVDTVRKYSHEGEPIKKAINECIGKGILADYLKRKGSEVRSMLIAEYNYEEDIQVKQEEAMQIGEQRGLQKGRQRGLQKGLQQGVALSGQVFQMLKKDPGLTDEQVAEEAGCTVEDVGKVRKAFGI